MKKLRLFHFDIKTYGNYGDTLLFETVREVFNGYAGGRAFEVYDSRPLREAVGPGLVDYINDNFDGVIVGGGGLFLRDTNPNQRSGWQWNISVPMLRRLAKPLIIFAVGNNRFIDQPDFEPPFTEHVNLTLEKSVFFGLRNHGSIETIRPYIEPARRDRVVFQPCPTTISSYLYPDLYRDEITNERRIGVHAIVGKRQAKAGFDAEAIYRAEADVLQRLAGDGWQVDSLPHARADMGFAELISERGLVSRQVRLWGDKDLLYRGIEEFADLPIMLGTRGHAQMVPFGMGAIPLSLFVHHKIGYFAADIGHPEWAVDPRADDFTDRLYEVINTAHEAQPELRRELARVRAGFFRTTMENLATIYRRIAGSAVDESAAADFEPLPAIARPLAERAFAATMARDKLIAKQRLSWTEGVTDDEVAGWIRDRGRSLAEDGARDRGQALRRAAEILRNPDAPATPAARAARYVRRRFAR